MSIGKENTIKYLNNEIETVPDDIVPDNITGFWETTPEEDEYINSVIDDLGLDL